MINKKEEREGGGTAGGRRLRRTRARKTMKTYENENKNHC